MKELCQLLDIQQNISTAFHPQTNGASECMNQWLEQYLHLWVADTQTTWAQFLSMAEFTHNSWPHDKSGQSPHQLLFSTQPLVPQTSEEAWVPNVKDHLGKVWAAQDKAQKAFQTTRECPIPVEFKEGTQVWLEGCHLKTHHPTMKLAPRRYGPFTITAKLLPVTYHLNLPPCMKIHNIFHVNLLTPYHKTKIHGPNYERPPSDIIEGEPKWEVKAILGSQLHGQQWELQFLVK